VKINTAMAVRKTVGRLIADLYAGKLHPRIAAGLAPLMNLQLRAIKTADLEQRMVRIENLLAKSEGGPEAKAAPEDALQDSGEARPPRSDP
jgi:hypothetical protein